MIEKLVSDINKALGIDNGIFLVFLYMSAVNCSTDTIEVENIIKFYNKLRDSVIMKFKDKKTNEIFESNKIGIHDNLTGLWKPLYVSDVEFINDIDWEARRFELIKAALQGFSANESLNDISSDGIANMVIEQADAVIEKLKAE